MNINIYLEDELAHHLKRVSEKEGKNRNQIIREAIRQWLNQKQKEQWPDVFLEFKGHPNIKPFESGRNELLPSQDGIFE